MRMVYKYPSITRQNVIVEVIEDNKILKETFDYKIIEDDSAPTEMWSFNAQSAYDKLDNNLPTREELEQKANELGIKYRSYIKDEVLLSKINEALKV